MTCVDTHHHHTRRPADVGPLRILAAVLLAGALTVPVFEAVSHLPALPTVTAASAAVSPYYEAKVGRP